MMPPFHGERMRAYGHDMAAHHRRRSSTAGATASGVVLHKELQEVTLRVILRSVFGMTEGPRTVELGRLIVEYLDAIMTPWFYGATLVLSGARVRDFLRARGAHMRDAADGERTPSRWPLQSVADRVGAIDAILFDEIARCRAPPAPRRAPRAPTSWRCWSPPATTTAARMADDELRDHLMTLLVGGHETTATSLSWALACALQNPGTLERMREEVDRVFGDGFDPAKVKQLAYHRRRRQRVDAPLPHRHRACTRILKRDRAPRRLRAPRRHARLALHLPHAARRARLARARRASAPSASSTARRRSTSSSRSAPASGAASARSSPSTRCASCWRASSRASTSTLAARRRRSSRCSAASPSRRRTACRCAFSASPSSSASRAQAAAARSFDHAP